MEEVQKVEEVQIGGRGKKGGRSTDRWKRYR
jgi:hypothetical protein